MTSYSFDNTWKQARRRLSGIEARFDAGTIRILEACGVSPAWRCLEVGGGGGSIVAWLCERVGPEGYVLATDLDTRFLEALAYPNLDVRRHDIVSDELPEGAFDFVHSRMLLSHLPERDTALRHMAAALKPGGWLVCEELDDLSVTLVSPDDAASQALYMKIEAAVKRVMEARGHVYDYGRRLVSRFNALGLLEVEVEGRVVLRQAGPGAQVARLTVEQLRDDIVRSGLATPSEIETYLALLANPAFVAVPATLFAARGRRTAV